MAFEMDLRRIFRFKCELCGKIFTGVTRRDVSARVMLHAIDIPKKGSHAFSQGEECFVFHPDLADCAGTAHSIKLIKVQIMACAFSEMHVPTYVVKAEFGEFTVFADQAYVNGFVPPK